MRSRIKMSSTDYTFFYSTDYTVQTHYGVRKCNHSVIKNWTVAYYDWKMSKLTLLMIAIMINKYWLLPMNDFI